VVHSPPEPNWPSEWHAGPCIGYDKQYVNDTVPRYGVIVNAWNRERQIRVTVTQLLKLTRGYWELILVSDGSNDKTAQRAMDVLERMYTWPVCAEKETEVNEHTEWKTDPLTDTFMGIGKECYYAGHEPWKYMVRARVVIVPLTGILEPSANNLGMRMAEFAEFVIVMHDDMYMTSVGWNVQAAVPLKASRDVFSASMRCGHGWNIGSLIGLKCSNPAAPTPNVPWVFYVRDSGNRGPLIIRNEYARAIGYMDEVRIYIQYPGRVDNSDHEMHARAYGNGNGLYGSRNKWVSGYIPVPFTAPSSWVGGGRETWGTNETLEASIKYKDWVDKRHSSMASAGLIRSGGQGASNTHDETRQIPPKPRPPFAMTD